MLKYCALILLQTSLFYSFSAEFSEKKGGSPNYEEKSLNLKTSYQDDTSSSSQESMEPFMIKEPTNSQSLDSMLKKKGIKTFYKRIHT